VYTGAGVPINLVAKGYIYDGTSEKWASVDSLSITLHPGDIAFLGIPQLIDAPQIPGGDPYVSTVDSIEFALVVQTDVLAPDGTYTFMMGMDISEIEDEAGPGAVSHVIVDSSALPLNASTETTLGKILWGQSGTTTPTAVADPVAVKSSAATPVVPSVYAGAALNGAAVVAGALTAPHNVTVTTAVHAATYKTGAPNALVVTGTEYFTHLPVSEALVLTAAGGGETISGIVLFDAATISIAVPAQNDALGAFSFGTGTAVAGTQHVIDTAAETVLGTTADAKVDTDAVGTISSKARGMVSRLLSLDTNLGAIADAKVDTDTTGSISAKLRGAVSRLLSIDTNLGALADAAVDSDTNGSLNAHARGIVKLLLGTGKLIMRGGIKGVTTAADVTSTAHGADHQSLDTTPYGATAIGDAPVAAANPLDLGAVVLDADPAAGTDTKLGRMRLDSLYRLFVRSYGWVSAKGASVALAITGRAVGPDVNTMDVWNNAPTHAIYNYSTSRGDGTAVWASTTTITFTGPTLTSTQLVRVRCFVNSTSRVLVWEQGHNATLSIAAGVITVKAWDGTVAPLPDVGDLIEVMWSNQDKAYDTSLQAQRVAPMYGPNSMYDDPSPIADTTAIVRSDSVYYYPSSTGVDISGRCDVAFDFSAVSGAGASPLYMWIEACDDNTFPGATALPTTSPLNISYNCALISSATPLGNQSVTATAGATARGLWQVENLNMKFVRFCFLSPAGNAAVTGAVKVLDRTKYQ